MAATSAPEPDPSAIGRIPKPPFAHLPDPAALFSARARRFDALAAGHGLGPYLGFLAGLARVQDAVARETPPASAPPVAALARARTHAMPPLNRDAFAPDRRTFAILAAVIARTAALSMPEAAQAALSRLAATAEEGRAGVIGNVLADAVPFEEVAEHAIVAAALQVDFAARAATLDAAELQPVADGVCPACGSAPVASVIVRWPHYEGNRYCTCSLCATMWHYVRAKCTLCGKTGKIGFREVEGGDGAVKAEVCGDCKGYAKVLYAERDAALDPVADDVATLALDLLLRGEGFRRGAVNPFLTGY